MTISSIAEHMEATRSYQTLYDNYVSFRRCANAIIVARDGELRKVGATTAKAAIMSAIDQHGGKASLGGIARLLVLAPHSVVGAVNRMEREGLVRRRKGGEAHDQRLTLASLTKKGRAVWSKVKRSQELITRAFSVFSDEEIRQFKSFLDKLRLAALEQRQGYAPTSGRKLNRMNRARKRSKSVAS